MDPDRYHSAATIQYRFDPLVNEYLRRSIGIEAANKVYQTQAPAAYWTIRFFRDSEKEEYLVVLRPDGAPHSVHHTLPEEAPGANLSKEAAQQRAEAYLLQARMLDLSQWNLVDSQSDKLPARTDHSFTWEQNAAVASLGGDEGAHVRMDVRVQGDESSGYRVYIHLPEEWLRLHSQDTLATTAHANALFGLIGAFVVAVLVAFLRNLKQPSAAAVPWRRLARWTLPVLAAFVVWVFTNIPQYLAAYPTENSLTTYLGMTGVSFVLGSAAVYGVVFVLLGLGWFFLARAYGSEVLPGFRVVMPALYYRDALVLGACGVAICLGMARLRDLLERLWPVNALRLPGRRSRWALTPRSPALQALAGAVMSSFIAVGNPGTGRGIRVILPARSRGSRSSPWASWPCLPLPAGAVRPSCCRTWSWAGLRSSWLWWVVRRVTRFNLRGYLLIAALLVLANRAAGLLQQPNFYFRANGGVLLAAGLALLLWPLLAWRRGSARTADGSPGGGASPAAVIGSCSK